MKKTFNYTILAITLSLAFASCTSDDSSSSVPIVVIDPNNPNNPANPNNPTNPETPTNKLLGKWKKVSISDESGANFQLHDHECATAFDYIQFSGDGTFKDISYTDSCIAEIDEQGTYNLNGNILSFFVTDEGTTNTVQVKVISVTNTTLKVLVQEVGIIMNFELI